MGTETGGGHWIDTLGQAMAARPDRRVLLRGVVAILGVLMAGRRAEVAAAACKKVGRRCDRNADCCDGATCKGGKCTCKSGFDECGDDCIKLDTDERNCGACDNACAAGEACCGGGCVDVQTDSENCGACGATCRETEACRFGGVCASCFPRTACGGVCVDVTTDRDNCGACGSECTAVNQFCGNGFCRSCDLLAGERPCVSVCCTGGRLCIDGGCEPF